MAFNALNGAIPFLLLPILTAYLIPSDYGTVSLFQTTLAFIIPLVGLSMGFNIDRLFFKVSKDELSLVIGNMVFLLLIVVVIFTLLIIIFSSTAVLNFVGLPYNWILIAPVIAGFSTLNAFNLILLRNKDSVKSFGVWQISLTVLNLGLSLLFVVCLTMDWKGRALGIVLATALLGVFSLFNVYRMGYAKFVFKREVLEDVLRICLPLLLQGIGVFIIFQCSYYFINIFQGKSDVGIYSVAIAFASIMGIFKDALVKTINPWFYKNLNSVTEGFKMKIVKMNILIYVIFIIFTFLIFFSSKVLIFYMIDIKYHAASNILFLLTLALAFNGIVGVNSVYFIHLSKTKILSVLTGITAVLSLLLNYFLIKEMGLVGASYAFSLSLLIHMLLTAVYAQKIYPLPYKLIFKTIIFKIIKNK